MNQTLKTILPSLLFLSLLAIVHLGFFTSGVAAAPGGCNYGNNWSDNSTCNATCGGGFLQQINTANSGSTGVCPPQVRYTACNTQGCPIDCVWGPYGANSTCSTTCGGGTMTATRSKLVTEANGGTCTGTGTITYSCNPQACPIDCVWGPYGANSTCTVTCAGGTKTATRTKTVVEANGGTCTGTDTITYTCNEQGCPVDCTWGEWSNVGTCTTTCGGGSQTQTRTKTVVESNGGTCPGSSTQLVPCNTDPCPINCHFTDWADSGACGVTCGTGTNPQTRTKDVNEQFGGTCLASDWGGTVDTTRSVPCTLSPCPVDCVFDTVYSACQPATPDDTWGCGQRPGLWDITYYVTVPDAYGGMPCPANLTDLTCWTAPCDFQDIDFNYAASHFLASCANPDRSSILLTHGVSPAADGLSWEATVNGLSEFVVSDSPAADLFSPRSFSVEKRNLGYGPHSPVAGANLFCPVDASVTTLYQYLFHGAGISSVDGSYDWSTAQKDIILQTCAASNKCYNTGDLKDLTTRWDSKARIEMIPRINAALVEISSSYVFIIGGESASGFLNDVWSFNFHDASANRVLAPIYAEENSAPFTPRSGVASGFLVKPGATPEWHGRVLVVGGRTGEVSVTNELWVMTMDNLGFGYWQTSAWAVPTDFAPRAYAGSTVYNNLLWVLGGLGPLDTADVALGDLWTIDLDGNFRRLVTTVDVKRYGHAVHVINSAMYVFGGSYYNQFSDASLDGSLVFNDSLVADLRSYNLYPKK